MLLKRAADEYCRMLRLPQEDGERKELWKMFMGTSMKPERYKSGPPGAITMVPKANYPIHMDPSATATPAQAERSKTYFMLMVCVAICCT